MDDPPNLAGSITAGRDKIGNHCGNPVARIRRRGKRLCQIDSAFLLVEEHPVGEGSANIDGDLKLFHCVLSGLESHLDERGIVDHALVRQPRKIDGLVTTLEQQFRHCPPDRRPLLQPRTGESGGNVEVG